ncbi:MAG: transcriptional regulator [Rhizobiaceae bacterium]
MEEDETNSEDPLVFLITGTVKQRDSISLIPFNALLVAADDDSAVRNCLNALAREGHQEANLDQIGNLLDRPEEEKFQNAYDAAVAGEVALVFFKPETH